MALYKYVTHPPNTPIIDPANYFGFYEAASLFLQERSAHGCV